ncbi:MAG TPA: hypothetical protein VE398_02790, partial [Acidobacteriota bacterium]|nr:hypothetical protein [Acidobacteriota bacterium]
MLRFGDKDETSYSLPQGAAFRGLLSFQEADHDRFYGRELDTISLFERITHQEFHFGVLYGDSGCGKTSLLKAGLIPKLWESGYLPVYCRSHTDPLVTLVEECQRATRIRRKPEEDLTEYLRRVSKEMDASLVLIWDQFEEFFIHFRSRNERDSFIEFVGACCCEVNLPVKFLLSMRADFLHLVNSEMGTRIRDPLLSSRLYQLRNFDRQQASRIIDLSARRADLPFEKGLSDEVARDLAVGGAVLPSELQIVGEQLQNKRIFTPRDYRRAGGKEPLAQSYLEDVIQGSGEPQKARLLLRSLISDENTRLTLSLDEIARRMQHGRETAARLVDHFARARIINQLQDVEPWRYELMHEYLVEKINQITGMLLDATHRANRLFRQYLSNYAMDKGTRIPLGRLWSIHRHSDMDRGKTQAELIRKSFRAGLIRWGALAMLFAVGSILVAAALSITEEWEETRLGDGHVGPARQIAFSPDGSRLVSCGEDGSVIVWDFARRVRLATFNENIGQVTAVAFSNDGRWIAAGGSTGAVIVWDGSTHKRVCVLGEHPNPIGTLAFSPDSHLLLTTEGNYRTVVWETGSWKKLNDLPFGSPFGNLLFVTNRVVMECRGQAWDLETGGRANIRCQDKILHTSAALSPDRKHLATIDASGVVAFWNWGTCTPEVQATVHKDHGRAVAWSPDGNWVATGAENIVFWDAAARAQLARLESPADVWSLAFSPDSHWLVSSHGDGSILVWDAVKRELVGDLKAHSGPVSAVSFSPDGRRLASAGVDGTIIVWDTGRGTKEDVFVEENARINSLAFSPDGKSIASCAQSGIVSLWDIHDRRPRWIVESHDQWNLYCVAIAPDGRSVALDHDVLTCGDGKRVADLTTRLGPGAIYGLSFAPDGRLLACACPAAARLTLLGTADWQVVDYQKADRILQQLRVVSFSPDGQWLVTGDNNGAVRLWQAKPLRQVALIGRHKDRVKSVAFSADGRRIVSASDDKTIAIWDVKGRKLITQIGSHAAPVSSIALSIDGRIASGEWDNSVRIYNRHRV